MVDHYQVLEVSRTATATEIKAAYKRLAMKFHPDHNPHNPFAEEYFKRVNEAYRILGDTNRKYLYDASLAMPQPAPATYTTPTPTPNPTAYAYTTPNTAYQNDYDPKNFVSKEMQRKIWIGAGAFGVLMIVLGLWTFYLLNERSARIYLDQAKQLYKDKEPRQALIRIANAISHKLHYYEAYMLRAQIRQESLNYHQAIEDYEFVLAHKPFKEKQERADLYFLCGMCYYKAYDFVHGLKEFERALQIAPQNDIYLFFRVACLIKEGKQTIEHCEQAQKAHMKGIKEAEELMRIYCAQKK